MERFNIVTAREKLQSFRFLTSASQGLALEKAKAKESKAKTKKAKRKKDRGSYTIPDHGYYIDTRGRERELKPVKFYNVDRRYDKINFPDIISLSGKLITSEGSRIACRYPQDLSRERAILSRGKKNRRWKQRLHRKGIGV